MIFPKARLDTLLDESCKRQGTIYAQIQQPNSSTCKYLMKNGFLSKEIVTEKIPESMKAIKHLFTNQQKIIQLVPNPCLL